MIEAQDAAVGLTLWFNSEDTVEFKGRKRAMQGTVLEGFGSVVKLRIFVRSNPHLYGSVPEPRQIVIPLRLLFSSEVACWEAVAKRALTI